MRKLRPEDTARFPVEYQKWLDSADGEPIQGTPLGELACFQSDPGSRMALEAKNIHTIEQLADMHDGQLTNISKYGGFKIRESARDWLKSNSVNEEMEAMKAEIAALKAMQATGTGKKKPGPKPKSQASEEVAA